MEISLKLNKDFEKILSTMSEKYGEDFEYLNGIHETQLDFSGFIDNFVDKKSLSDVSIDANANVSTKDIRNLMSEKIKPHDKILAANKIFYEIKKKYGLSTAKKWFETEYNGGFYGHNFSTSTFLPYCYAYDLSRVATEGLFFLENYNNQPPKHLTTFLDDVIEFVSFMCNRSSGACGMPNVLIWVYYFWKKDCLSGHFIKNPNYYLKQQMQKLVFRLNQPFLRISEASFTNVSIFDKYYIEGLFGDLVFPDGSLAIDQIDEIIEVQKIFMEVVSKTRSECMFTFPVLTYALLYKDGKFQHEDFARWCSDHNVDWCDSNFFFSDDVTILSSCCRVLASLKLDAFINSVGGTALSVGSVQVNTLNLMRIALESQGDKKKFLSILKKRSILSCKVLDIIRCIIKRNIEKGLLPNYQDGGVELDKQYNTFGIASLYEAIEELGMIEEDKFGNKKYSEDGLIFASKILDAITETTSEFEKDKDYSINIESVPMFFGHKVG